MRCPRKFSPCGALGQNLRPFWALWPHANVNIPSARSRLGEKILPWFSFKIVRHLTVSRRALLLQSTGAIVRSARKIPRGAGRRGKRLPLVLGVESTGPPFAVVSVRLTCRVPAARSTLLTCAYRGGAGARLTYTAAHGAKETRESRNRSPMFSLGYLLLGIVLIALTVVLLVLWLA